MLKCSNTARHFDDILEFCVSIFLGRATCKVACLNDIVQAQIQNSSRGAPVQPQPLYGLSEHILVGRREGFELKVLYSPVVQGCFEYRGYQVFSIERSEGRNHGGSQSWRRFFHSWLRRNLFLPRSAQKTTWKALSDPRNEEKWADHQAHPQYAVRSASSLKGLFCRLNWMNGLTTMHWRPRYQLLIGLDCLFLKDFQVDLLVWVRHMMILASAHRIFSIVGMGRPHRSVGLGLDPPNQSWYSFLSII